MDNPETLELQHWAHHTQDEDKPETHWAHKTQDEDKPETHWAHHTQDEDKQNKKHNTEN
jgi:hypothetical protein